MFRTLGFFTWTSGAAVASTAKLGGMMMVHGGYIRNNRRNNYYHKVLVGEVGYVGKLLSLGITTMVKRLFPRKIVCN